jgi:hypothetical protein
MDFVLALLPWKVIWKLQMKRKEKVGVALAMSMGILSVPHLKHPTLTECSPLQCWRDCHSENGCDSDARITRLYL